MKGKPLGTLGAIAICLAISTARIFADDSTQEYPTGTINGEDVRFFFETTEKMDPSKHGLWEKLREWRGDLPEYQKKDVMAVLGIVPKMAAPTPDNSKFRGASNVMSANEAARYIRLSGVLSLSKKTEAQLLADYREQFKNMSKEEVEEYFAKQNASAPPQPGDLSKKYKNGPYPYSEVHEYALNGQKPVMEDAPVTSVPPPTGFWAPIEHGFLHPLIRKSWSDVLSSDDPSQDASSAKQKTSDLVGATFSFADDTDSHTQTWNAVGALILPFDFRFAPSSTSPLTELVLAPSVSVNRISTDPPAKTDTDQLFFRLGLFTDLETHGVGIQLRTAFVYGTDTEFGMSMPAFEADIEPQFSWNPTNPPSVATRYFKIGYRNILIPFVSGKPDPTNISRPDPNDNSLLDYQLRLYAHAEGGDLQRSGSTLTTTTGTFFRVGPAAQLRVNAPHAVFNHPLSFTGSYEYLPSIEGVSDKNYLLTLDLTLGLIPLNPANSTALQQKLSLNFDFTDGALDFTKQEVKKFTVGLSILY